MYQLKISIEGITPLIWRTIVVPETFTINQLHHIIQISFSWTNSHLYMFGEYENKIGDPILWDDGETVSDREVKIENVLQEVGDKLKYEYLLAEPMNVSIELYDVSGKTNAMLISNVPQNAGMQNGELQSSRYALTSGVYFMRFTFDKQVVICKIVKF